MSPGRKEKFIIIGKCCIVNSLAMSKLIYYASLLPMPHDNYIKSIKHWYIAFY